MSERGGAAAAVSALTAKAKLAGMWREKVDQHNTGNPVYERIERVIVEHTKHMPGRRFTFRAFLAALRSLTHSSENRTCLDMATEAP
jgi:hypothetical protein